MRVLIVATAYPRFKGDIITPWLVELIKKLKKQGIDVSVFTSSYKGLGNQVLEGVRIYRFRYFPKKYERLTHEETAVDRFRRGTLNKILSIFYIIFGSIAITQLVKTNKFDIIHIHWPFPHIIFGVLAKNFGHARLFASFHGAEIRWLKKKFSFLIYPFSILINKSDVVTTNSNHTAKELIGIIDKNVEIIPFGVTVGNKHGEITDQKEIIFVGRLVERKGVKYLIEAYHKIKDEIPHRLIIIGDGPERQRLEQLANSLDLKDRVFFAGFVSDNELNSYYLRSSFFVLPAVYDRKGDTEGLGVVLIEAMSYSKPVIASGVGGITDVVFDQDNGILVPPTDVSALAEAMKLLATNESLRNKMGMQAKGSVDERFNWDKITKRLITLYEKNS
jgi:glycosyltransferase involved in cell wall biosynthesis